VKAEPGYDDVVTPPPNGRDRTPLPWRILSGLAVSGFLVALPGGLLPLWGYHVMPDFGTAANYFLMLGIGLVAASLAGHRFRAKFEQARLLPAGCFAGALAMLLLSVAAPPAAVWYQNLTLLLTGIAAGAINSGVFEPIALAYEANPAGVALTGGVFFGAGSVLAAWLLADCLDSANPARLIAVAALLPGLAGVAFGRMRPAHVEGRSLPVGVAMRDLRSVLAILFALLLFFQFANEWAIAGWLPVFLIDRLGMNPGSAVMLLMLYWLALTAGRVVATRLLGRIPHGRMLTLSAFCALFGCLLLLVTDKQFGVVVGILLTGAGFSAIYPLAAERIATRFTYYHPGYFNGIFTFAMAGGILAPFLFGYLASAYGLRMLPLMAMLGSCAVLVLISLIWLGRKVSGS
jgi:FSR family fosmidomycin resistance protein-like MFS transporter